MRSYVMFTALAVVICVWALLPSSTASAYIINYGADGLPGGTGANADTPLFYDGFEWQPTDPVDRVSHSPYPDTTLEARPRGPVLYGGSWQFATSALPNENIQVTDYKDTDAVPPGIEPGAFEGNNYVRLYRTSGTVDQCTMVLPSVQTAGTIHYEEMVYITQNANTVLTFGLSNSTFGTIGVFQAALNGAVSYLNSSVQWTAVPGLTYSRNTWQKWEIDYAVGSTDSITITVNDVSKTGNYLYNTTDTSVGYAFIGTGNISTPSYFDEPFSIPEPGSVVLLLSGVVGLLAYAWRKRK